MTTRQKIIKYLALALAAFLVVTIISSIFMGLTIFSGVLGLKFDNEYKDLKKVQINNPVVNSLEIELVSTKLEIKGSQTFNIESNNDNLRYKEENGKLEIEEKRGIFDNVFKNSKIIIYLPKDEGLKNLLIDSGAGTIEINNVNIDDLELDIGAGNVNINGLEVSHSSEISGGAGELVIKNGTINNLNLDVGVGRCEINSIIAGNSNIEAGIGELEINLLDNLNNYSIHLEKGIGNISLNNEKAQNSTYGSGDNLLKIESGIGNINITTLN